VSTQKNDLISLDGMRHNIHDIITTNNTKTAIPKQISTAFDKFKQYINWKSGLFFNSTCINSSLHKELNIKSCKIF
jgi:hypothetical protein